MKEFRGAYSVTVTPFTDDGSGIDEKALRRFVDWQIDEGVPGLIPLGSTGEFLAVSDDERTQVVKATIDQAAGRVPVLVGTANHRTEVAVRYSQEAQDLGADGLMIIPPYYYKASDEEIFTYYQRIDEAVSIPIMLYNNPFNNRIDMSAEFVARLWRELDNIKYIKEASGVTERVYEVRRLTDDGMIVFGGWRPFEAYLLGAKGHVSPYGNYMPRQSVALYDLTVKGDLKAAEALYNTLLEITTLIGGQMAVQKALCRLVGYPMGDARPPRHTLAELGEDGARRLAGAKAVLEDLGLIPVEKAA
ncbi:MAG: dihydrodipicolinate synthase family protein [Rhodospirillales bacterium]|jgi:4-hydroxy-tetrahydrodipicolinate synthase|nr:dihydrodipicolinate synthase family protein [Rhodospirillales bacterium]